MSQISLKVASANLNQTIVNFTQNVPNIKAAIDKAAEDGADVLALQELGLTGYSGDDEFKWIRGDSQQKELLELVQEIADYAAEKNPNLVLSLGFPFFYADKTQNVKTNVGTAENPVLVDNPLYNINNRPFNAVATLSGGKIHCISAKSIQPDGAAEYEPRQFTSWPDYLGVKQVTFPDPKHPGQALTVPFGKVVAQLGEGQERATIYHEICAEGWPGLGDDNVVNKKEMDEARYLNRVVAQHDISLTINNSTSKPEPFINKPELRATLCKTGSAITKGGYIYTNSLGLEAAPAAFEGGSIYATNGEVVHRSARYSMADVVYSSATMELPVPNKGTPDVVIPHTFGQHAAHEKKGSPAAWEDAEGTARETEEVVRNTALWIRDYLKKTGLQGFVISLSGGADSAFGAVMVSQAIDLNIQELQQAGGSKEAAVAAFINQFPQLKYRGAVLEELKSNGADAAIALLKKNMLTCIYLPSDNSGITTQDAARTLIEGGELVTVDLGEGKTTTVVFNAANGDRLENGVLHKIQNNDKTAIDYTVLSGPIATKGIGGKFEVLNVQASVDSLIEAFMGMVHKDALNKEIDDPAHPGKKVNLLLRAKQEIRAYVAGKIDIFSSEVERALNNKEPSRRLTWKPDSSGTVRDDVTLQNIQARARQPYPWMFANQEGKIACVTSNWSEAVAGYWTFGGDGHMGAINLCGGVPKSKLKRILRDLETHGLEGGEKITALNPVNVQIPTAELRPTEQSDEADMMPYKMLDAIGDKIFCQKMTPLAAYKNLQEQRDPEDPSRLLFGKPDAPNEVDRTYLAQCIEKACNMWHRSQFKRVGAVITPFLGQNVDPHTSVRTTILGDTFKNGLAQMKLEYLKETTEQDVLAASAIGKYLERPTAFITNHGLRKDMLETRVNDLPAAINNTDFGKTQAASPQVR